MKYLVVTKNYNKELFSAIDIDDLLLFLAQYFGNDKRKPVLRCGINGCNTIDEKVEMYNALTYFDDDKIKQIYEIGEHIYGEANDG